MEEGHNSLPSEFQSKQLLLFWDIQQCPSPFLGCTEDGTCLSTIGCSMARRPVPSAFANERLDGVRKDTSRGGHNDLGSEGDSEGLKKLLVAMHLFLIAMPLATSSFLLPELVALRWSFTRSWPTTEWRRVRSRASPRSVPVRQTSPLVR